MQKKVRKRKKLGLDTKERMREVRNKEGGIKSGENDRNRHLII